MQRLSARDLRIVVDVACQLGEVDSAGELQSRLLRELRRVVAYDSGSWNLVLLDRRAAQIGAVDPGDCRRPGDEAIFGAYAHQNPMVTQGQGKVRKFSDYLSRTQLHQLDIYNYVYRPREIEYQIAFSLPAPCQRDVIGVALSRRRLDFSERDRAVLELIAPAVVKANKRVDGLGHRAERPEVQPADWQLTGREREILSLVASGLTNVQIAHAIGASDRTVAKHLEHAYAKLDVPNRMAAVAKLRQSAGPPGPEAGPAGPGERR